MKKFKIFIYIITILYAAYVDYKKRIIPDKIHVILILLALIKIDLVKSLAGLFLLPIPFIIPTYKDFKSVGGGDIKLIGSMGLFLGINKGVIAIIISLTIALIFNLIIFKKGKKEIFPLAPYIAIGSIITILI